MSVEVVKSKLIGQLLTVADEFCAATGMSRASLAKALFGRGGHLDDLQAGFRDLATGTLERAMLWLSENWPGASPWPAEIARPEQCDTFPQDADRVSSGPEATHASGPLSSQPREAAA